MRFLLPVILLLKKACPSNAFVLRIENWFWVQFWRQEEIEERKATPEDAPLLPIRGSERAVFIEAVASCWPSSVLDVGCGFGQNAHILCRLLPSLRYVGLDFSAQRVGEGQQILDKAGVSQARLVEGNALDLSAFADSSVDVVLSSAFLLYIAPDDLKQVITEMCRVAKKAIIILEQHDSSLAQAGREVQEQKRPPYWIRNYTSEFISRVSSLSVREFDVPAPRWTLEQWNSFARVFIFTLK